MAATTPHAPLSPAPLGGNCAIRGATRRRHADSQLLMLHNPHYQRQSNHLRNRSAWPGMKTMSRPRQHTRCRRCGGRRRVRMAWAGFEINHFEPLGSRVAISRAAGPNGVRITGGTTNNARTIARHSKRGRHEPTPRGPLPHSSMRETLTPPTREATTL